MTSLLIIVMTSVAMLLLIIDVIANFLKKEKK